MHIPDGFLDIKTCVSLSIVSIGIISFAIKKINKKIEEKHIPMMGVISAFIFAAQMLNFPIAGGTSGHFMGGALAAILLGPLTGVLVMTTILIVQCFVFQDGGLTTLGANIFNMGIIGSLLSYYLYLGINKIIKNKKGNFIGAFIISWLSIVLASGFCAIELAISKTVPLKIVLFSMVGIHSLIGIVEGLITLVVLNFILKIRPDLLEIKKI
ncbi:MAG: energy-coupling factor ABC transporter permease [bacterium]